jgi:hypothetical protein
MRMRNCRINASSTLERELMNDENAEIIARYQAIMDGGPIDGPIDPDARADVVKWLVKFRPATHARPMPARALNRR